MLRARSERWRPAVQASVVLGLMLAGCLVAGQEGFFSYASARATLQPPQLPSVPLLIHDPYLSVWSAYPSPVIGWAQHWSGKPLPMKIIVTVDDSSYLIFGEAALGDTVAPTRLIDVTATTTRYRATTGPRAVDLEFVTPKDVRDLGSWALPASLLYFTVQSQDGKPHAVEVLLQFGPAWAPVGDPSRALIAPFGVETEAGPVWGLVFSSRREEPFGEAAEWPLWGQHVMIGLPEGEVETRASPAWAASVGGISVGQIEAKLVAALSEAQAVAGSPGAFGELGWDAVVGAATPARPAVAFLRITNLDAIRLGRLLSDHSAYPPLWKSRFASEIELIGYLAREREALRTLAGEVDARIDKLGAAIENDYTTLLRTAYRQVLGSYSVVYDPQDGAPLLINKEISSGGFTNTIDVLYPAMPFFLVLNPSLVKPQLDAVFRAIDGWYWSAPYAPHDLGRFPHLSGQAYGAPMPVEESANMLLMMAAYIQATSDTEFAEAHWDWLTAWYEYLAENGLDPVEQIFTDDFTGPVARNAHLALKAVIALGGFAQMADAAGKAEVAAAARRRYSEMAEQWRAMAWTGDHIVRVYDDHSSWAIPYNAMLGRLLGLDVIPDDMWEREFAFLMNQRRRYGIPLENRFSYTKADWLLWIAAIAPTPEDRDLIINDVVSMLTRTPDRVPFTDWYDTLSARTQGFRARPVVGGVYAPSLFVGKR